MTQPNYIWIIGSPRSGTTFLTNLIGESTKYEFNEPWDLFPLGEQKHWNLPKDGTVVFKYCSNCWHYQEINKYYPNSIWIQIKRNPISILYSLVFEKADSYPVRKFYFDNLENKIKFAKAMQKDYLSQCDKVENKIIVKYENIDYNLLEDKLKIKLDKKKFINRNKFYDKNKMKLLFKFL